MTVVALWRWAVWKKQTTLVQTFTDCGTNALAVQTVVVPLFLIIFTIPSKWNHKKKLNYRHICCLGCKISLIWNQIQPWRAQILSLSVLFHRFRLLFKIPNATWNLCWCSLPRSSLEASSASDWSELPRRGFASECRSCCCAASQLWGCCGGGQCLASHSWASSRGGPGGRWSTSVCDNVNKFILSTRQILNRWEECSRLVKCKETTKVSTDDNK